MIDRQPVKPGRVKLTYDDGSMQYARMERADEPAVAGTPLNKANLFDDIASERYSVETPNEAFNLLGRDMVVNVPAAGWSSSANEDGYFTNQVEAVGMKESHNPIFAMEPVSANLLDDAKDAFSEVEGMSTFDGYVVFKAVDVPSADVLVRIKGV